MPISRLCHFLRITVQERSRARGKFQGLLKNLFGLGVHSARRIVPEWQTRSLGDFVFANRAGTGGWYVVELRPNEALAVFLAGDGGSGITGETIYVDCGYNIMGF